MFPGQEIPEKQNTDEFKNGDVNTQVFCVTSFYKDDVSIDESKASV